MLPLTVHYSSVSHRNAAQLYLGKGLEAMTDGKTHNMPKSSGNNRSVSLDELPQHTPMSYLANRNFWVEPKLQPLPKSHVLKKYSRTLQLAQEDLRTVTGNISHCLYLLSVQAACFDSPVAAALLTTDNVQIDLALWLAENRVVVEVLHRRGCKVRFHSFSRCILDAAGGDFGSSECMQRTHEMDYYYLKQAAELVHSTDDERSARGNEAALDVVLSLFEKDELEATLLALESLCVLTNPRMTGIVTAVVASRAVLLGVSPGQKDGAPFLRFICAILSVLQGHHNESVNWKLMNVNDKAGSLLPDEYLVFSLALNVLCLSLAAIVSFEDVDIGSGYATASNHKTEPATGTLSSFLKHAMDFSGLDIVKFLLEELGKAKRMPHTACISGKCLRFLCIASRDVLHRAIDLNATEEVKTAHELGTLYHNNLERECARLQKTLSAPE